jgi:hypothetical protein
VGFWPRVAVTFVAAVAGAAAGWLAADAAGAGQGTGLAVAGIAAAVVVTLGAAWASRVALST